jgi:hypothetical protein
MGLPYRSIYSASRGFRTNRGSSHGSKVLWDSYHERPGDFAMLSSLSCTVINSAYEVSYGESLRTMDEHVDGGSNPNEMAAVYKIIQTKEPRVHYKVGFYAAIFDCIETYSTG